MKMIPQAKPHLGKEEERAVIRILRSGLLSQGEKVSEFERTFADFIGVKHAIATSNGTTALHISLLAAGISKGDEVITSSFSFIASANSILYVGAKPVFVDVDYETFNLNTEEIEKKITKKTRAILPVHLFGLPANMDSIRKIAKKYNLIIIEDASQAHGAELHRKKIGSLGLAGTFSFYPTKNMTTSEGGVITTNDTRFAEKARLLREHGMKKRYHHEIIGYNFRMTNIAAAIGLEQLKKLPKFNKLRIKNARELTSALEGINGIIVPIIPDDYTHVFHQYTIKVKPDFKLSRNELMTHLLKRGIGSGIYYPIPIHQQKPYIEQGYKDKLPITETLSEEVLSLPVHPGLTESDLKRITRAFTDL